MDKKIYEMHRIQRMSVAQIAKELKMPMDKVAKGLYPDGYQKGDLIRCEYCGEFFNPNKNGRYAMTCSVSCGKKITWLLKTTLELPNFDGIMKAEPVKDTTTEELTERVWDEYLEEYVDVPIIKRDSPNKKLCETVNKAREARKSYGIYIADEDHKKANEKFFSMGVFDDSFQQYIDSVARR